MAVTSAVIGAVAAVAGAGYSIVAQEDAKRQAKGAAKKQEQSRDEQKAQQAQQAAEERRQQVREQRVRQARIMQSAQNTGVAGSSGEFGALGSLSTQFGTNMGAIAGRQQRSASITDLNQQAANLTFGSQQSVANSRTADQFSTIGGSIFQAAGGFSTLQTRFG